MTSFGHTQPASVLQNRGVLPMNGDFNTRQELDAHIQRATEFDIEYMLIPLIGDIAGIVIGGVCD